MAEQLTSKDVERVREWAAHQERGDCDAASNARYRYSRKGGGDLDTLIARVVLRLLEERAAREAMRGDDCVDADPRAQLASAREKIGELNRRCQAAESAAKQTIEQARRAGGSFGRMLANYAARLYERERDEARADAVRAAMYGTGLPPELALRIDEYRLQLEQQGEQSE
jgi:hypothetical protein